MIISRIFFVKVSSVWALQKYYFAYFYFLGVFIFGYISVKRLEYGGGGYDGLKWKFDATGRHT